jgi:hypothetical protein
MTYSVSHPVPRTPSARTLVVAGAITVSALTASALAALGPPPRRTCRKVPQPVERHPGRRRVSWRSPINPTGRTYELPCIPSQRSHRFTQVHRDCSRDLE